MKIEFELSKQDYENAYLGFFKSRLNYQLIIFLGFSAFATYIGYAENYKLINYIVSYFSLLVIISLVGVVPDYRNYKKALKIIDSNPDFVGLKSFELTKEGLISSANNNDLFRSWKEIKRIYTTKNYGFVILKNKTSIVFKKTMKILFKK